MVKLNDQEVPKSEVPGKPTKELLDTDGNFQALMGSIRTWVTMTRIDDFIQFPD